MPLFASPFPADITLAWQIMTRDRGLYTPTMVPVPLEEFAWPGSVEYGTRFQASDLGHIVLFAGNEPIGSIGFALGEGRTIEVQDKVFIEAVAQQAAIALRLVDLAEQSRQAIVVRERAEAQKLRLEELKGANAVMQRVQDRLSKDTDLKSLVGYILEEACQQVECPIGVVFLHEPKLNSHKLLISCTNGRSSRELPSLPWLETDGRISANDELFSELSRTRDLVIFEPGGFGPQCHPEIMRWMVECRFRLALNFPLIVANELVGFLGMSMHSPEAPVSSKLQLIRSLSQQISLAIEIERLTERARESAALAERGRIAGEIHDSLAQSFAAISMQLEAAEDAMHCNDESEATFAVARAKELARFGLSEARRSIMTMRPAQYLQLGLEHALSILVERTCIKGVLECRFQVSGTPRRLEGPSELEIFRIAQEAVSNAIRHGRPRLICLTLSFDVGEVSLTVSDDGNGIPADKAQAESGGLGAMRDRARLLGASFACESEPGKGTRIEVSVPIELGDHK